MRLLCTVLDKKLRILSSTNEIVDASTSKNLPPAMTRYAASSKSRLFDSFLVNQICYPHIPRTFPSLSTTHLSRLNMPIIGESITNPNFNTKSISELAKAIQLPQDNVGSKICLCYRIVNSDYFTANSFNITNIVMGRLNIAYERLGLVRKPLEVMDTPNFLLEKLVIKPIKRKHLVELFTGYQGLFGHFLILVNFGVGCTVWYTMGQSITDIFPFSDISSNTPNFIYELPNHYAFFKHDDYVTDHYQKLSFLLDKHNAIRKDVIDSIHNVFPEMEVEDRGCPYRTAVGLGILITMFIVTGLVTNVNPLQQTE